MRGLNHDSASGNVLVGNANGTFTTLSGSGATVYSGAVQAGTDLEAILPTGDDGWVVIPAADRGSSSILRRLQRDQRLQPAIGLGDRQRPLRLARHRHDRGRRRSLPQDGDAHPEAGVEGAPTSSCCRR